MGIFDQHLKPAPPASDLLPDPGKLNWTIRGKPVNLQWQSFDASAPGGYGELRDVWVSPRRGRRVPIEQGDLVTGYRQGGRIAYQGKVEGPAKYTGDVAIISVMGPRSTVDGFTDRLPYQIRDASA